jgi:hypothetical protein
MRTGGEVRLTSADSRTEGESLVCSHWLVSVRKIRCRLFWKHYHWWRNVDLRVRSRNKGPVMDLEFCFVPMAEESSPNSKKDKSVAHSFLQDGVVHHTYRLWVNSCVHVEITIWGFRFLMIYIFVRWQGYKETWYSVNNTFLNITTHLRYQKS